MVAAGAIVAPAAGAKPPPRLRSRTDAGPARPAPLERNSELVAGNAMGNCLPFFEAIALEERRTVRLGLSPAMAIAIDFDFPGQDDGHG
jgi:hypothetical protein